MKAIILFTGLLIFSQTSNAKSVTLTYAINKKLVTTKIKSNGNGHNGNCLQMYITNTSVSTANIEIPVGQILLAENEANQNMMVTEPILVSVPKGKTKTVDIFAMCIESSDRSPSEGDGYQTGNKATGDLLACANYIAENNIQTSAGQHAVWAFTDDLRVEGIYDSQNPEQAKNLAKFVADKKGVEVPWYNLIYKDPEGNMPFIEEVVDIKGVFNFTLSKNTKVSLAMYDEEGNEVISYFTNQEFPGRTSYIDFTFKAENFEKGTYFFRLQFDGEIIEEKEMVI